MISKKILYLYSGQEHQSTPGFFLPKHNPDNMKRIVPLVMFALSVAGGLRAQTLDEMLSVKPAVECSDIAVNSSAYYVKYMHECKLDSVRVILDYWETKCGVNEPIYRARVLLALQEGKFGDYFFSDAPLWYIFNYDTRLDMIRAGYYYAYDRDRPLYGYIRPGGEFDEFTMWLGGEMMKKYEPGSVEYLVAEFYSEYGSSEELFLKLQTDEYSGTALGKEYRSTVRLQLDKGDLHYAFVGGVWVPSGDLAELGVHPEFGFLMGFKQKRMSYDLAMIFKFGKPGKPYMAKREGVWEETDEFFGGYIGLEVGYDILQARRHEIQLSGGVAFDGIDVFKEDKKNNLKAVSANSLNLNVGVGYRFYTGRDFYLGLRARYNFVDYSRNGNIKQAGNVVTLGLQVGWLNNPVKKQYLDVLQYRYRK